MSVSPNTCGHTSLRNALTFSSVRAVTAVRTHPLPRDSCVTELGGQTFGTAVDSAAVAIQRGTVCYRYPLHYHQQHRSRGCWLHFDWFRQNCVAYKSLCAALGSSARNKTNAAAISSMESWDCDFCICCDAAMLDSVLRRLQFIGIIATYGCKAAVSAPPLPSFVQQC